MRLLRSDTLISRFLRDERGAVVVELLPVFIALVFIVLMIFEIGLGFYLNLATQKAAQLGARAAVTRDPVHVNVPSQNAVFYQNAALGDACYQVTGSPGCIDPGGPWVCNGASLGGVCREDVFDEILTEMRRADPSLDGSRVTITYIYRQLGYAGGPFIPEVRVDLAGGYFGFFSRILGSQVVTDSWSPAEGRTLGLASASAFGEDLDSSR